LGVLRSFVIFSIKRLLQCLVGLREPIVMFLKRRRG
jgi:hypothetical protein